MASGQALGSRQALAKPLVLFIEQHWCTPPAAQWRVRNRIITDLLNARRADNRRNPCDNTTVRAKRAVNRVVCSSSPHLVWEH